MDWQPPAIRTSRLLLRPLSTSDVAGVFAYASNPNVAEHMNFAPHRELAESLRFIEEYSGERYREGVPEPLGITLHQAPAQVLGVIGCWWGSQAEGRMELAYALAEEHWGTGYATEAAIGLIAHCFHAYAVNRIEAHCTTENARSARVLVKAGMRRESTLHASVLRRGRLWDRDVYAILRDDRSTTAPR